MDLNNRLLGTFKDFINDINEFDNEIGEKCKEHYKEIIELSELDNINNYEELSLFLNTLDKHSKKISDRDEKVIDSIKLKNIDIKKLWTNLEEINKNNIWKYLQTMCLIKLNIESNNELKNILSGENELDQSNKENLKTLKKMKLLKEGLNETNEKIENEEKSQPQNIENILNNTGIGNLAKEIAEGFELENEDPSEIMNPSNLMSLFTKINSTVQNKIESGDLDLSKVTSELPSLYSNMQQDPLFNQMMNMNTSNQEEQKEDTQEEQKEDKKEKVTKNKPKNKTQKRLQKKLEEKNKNK